MPHADEAQLHAYLDQQGPYANPDRRRELGRHIADCSQCLKLLREVRAIRDQAQTIMDQSAPPAAPVPPFEQIEARGTATTAPDQPEAVPTPTPPAPAADAPIIPDRLTGSFQSAVDDALDQFLDAPSAPGGEATSSDDAADEDFVLDLAEISEPLDESDDDVIEIETIDNPSELRITPATGEQPPIAQDDDGIIDITLTDESGEPDEAEIDIPVLETGPGHAGVDVPMIEDPQWAPDLTTAEEERSQFEEGVPPLEVIPGAEATSEPPMLELESPTDWETPVTPAAEPGASATGGALEITDSTWSEEDATAAPAPGGPVHRDTLAGDTPSLAGFDGVDSTLFGSDPDTPEPDPASEGEESLLAAFEAATPEFAGLTDEPAPVAESDADVPGAEVTAPPAPETGSGASRPRPGGDRRGGGAGRSVRFMDESLRDTSRSTGGGRRWLALAATVIIAVGGGAVAWQMGLIPDGVIPFLPAHNGPSLATRPGQTLAAVPPEEDRADQAADTPGRDAATSELQKTSAPAVQATGQADAPTSNPLAPAAEGFAGPVDAEAVRADTVRQQTEDRTATPVSSDSTPVTAAESAARRREVPTLSVPPVPDVPAGAVAGTTPAPRAVETGAPLTRADATARLGAPPLVIDGLTTGRMLEITVDGRPGVRVVQRTAGGSTVTVETIPLADPSTGGVDRPTDIEVTAADPTHSRGTARYGRYEIVVEGTVSAAELRDLMVRLVEAPNLN